MANLKDRLKQIQKLRKESPSQEGAQVAPQHAAQLAPESSPQFAHQGFDNAANFTMPGWDACGYQTLKREVIVNPHVGLQPGMPPALAVIVPDLGNIAQTGRGMPAPEDLVFFDLETTGLSGGAGTVAFLAAFGRFVKDGIANDAVYKLRITQYLLLDYPGENDFLELVQKELESEESVIVSYNGKCFDSQILKTRCLMNGIKPLVYLHADLLYPARRLWKNVTGSCAQAYIETQILGVDRSGDIPGALAPEIWFEFLRTGRTDRLLGICDHNCADITGLSSIFAVMSSIAADPIGSRFNYDIGRIAIYWRNFLNGRKAAAPAAAFAADIAGLQEEGRSLLRFAADKKHPRAIYVYVYDQMRNGNYAEALEYANMGLKIFEKDSIYYEKLTRRKERIEKKMEP